MTQPQTDYELTIPVSATGSAGMETCFVNLVEPGDEVRGKLRRLTGIGADRSSYEPVWADPDAEYIRELEYDLSAIEPVVALPHKVDNVRPVTEVEGMEINQALLGTCTNGRLSDLRAANGLTYPALVGVSVGDTVSVLVEFPGVLGTETSVTVRCYELGGSEQCGVEIWLN